jgi:hypothetical protein
MGDVEELIGRLRAWKAQYRGDGDESTIPLAAEAADALASLQAERDALRAALIQAGRAAGAILADTVSTDFLLLVPAEVQARLAAVEAERDAARDKALEEAAAVCESIYDVSGHAAGDWPTPDECATAIRKLKEQPHLLAAAGDARTSLETSDEPS